MAFIYKAIVTLRDGNAEFEDDPKRNFSIALMYGDKHADFSLGVEEILEAKEVECAYSDDGKHDIHSDDDDGDKTCWECGQYFYEDEDDE